MNKKGGEKLLSVWWFLVLAIVAGAIVLGVTAYYSGGNDVRKIEADILAEKLFGCVQNNGYFNSNFLKSDFDINKECGLSEKIFGQGSDFYFRINIRELGKVFSGGDLDLDNDCEVAKTIRKAQYLSRCSYRFGKVLYADENGVKDLTIEIKAGSNQRGDKILGG